MLARAALRDFAGDLLLVYGDLPFLRAETFRALDRRPSARRCGGVAAHRDDRRPDRLRAHRARRERPRERASSRNATARRRERAIREINVGVYCVDADCSVPGACSASSRRTPRAELYLTDIVALARAAGRAHRRRAGDRRRRRADQLAAPIWRRGRRPCETRSIGKWMAAGVTLEDPATAYIGPDVVIGRDTVIGPNVILRGATRIGDRLPTRRHGADHRRDASATACTSSSAW